MQYEQTSKSLPDLFTVLENTDYDNWRKVHHKLTQTVGEYLLGRGEIEISNIFSKWESDIQQHIADQTPISNMSCLLALSLLHYFRRSADQMKILFPLVGALSLTNNHDVCMAFVKTVKMLAVENKENIPFAIETIDATNFMLSADHCESYGFNAMRILEKLAQFNVSSVILVTSKHVKDILNFMGSSDSRASKIAFKLLVIHIRYSPYTAGYKLASSLFRSCVHDIINKPNTLKRSFNTIEAILKVYPDIVHLESLHDVILTRLSTSEYPDKVGYRFIVYASKKKPSSFSLEFMVQLFTIMWNYIAHNKDVKYLLLSMKVIITHIHLKSIPIKLVPDICKSIIKSNDHQEYHSIVYDVISSLIDRQPGLQLNKYLFTTGKPTISFLRALKRQPQHYHLLESSLREWCMGSLAFDSTPEQNEIAIFILKNFGSSLYKSIDNVFDQMMLLARSKDSHIRMLAIRSLVKINSSRSVPIMIQTAVFDPDKKIRLMAVRMMSKLQIETPSALLPLLSDSSFQVKRAAIPVISDCISYDPLIEPQLSHYIHNFIMHYMSYLGTKEMTRACTVLQLYVQYFYPLIQNISPNIIRLCTSLILNGGKIADFREATEPIKENIEEMDYHPLDLLKYEIPVFRSQYLNDDKGLLWQRVYKISNEANVERRDIALFWILDNVATDVKPFIPQVVPAFVSALTQNHTQEYYLAALTALKSIVIQSQCQIKLTSAFPSLLTALFSLLNSEGTSEKVSIAIMKLIGSIGSPGALPTQTAFEKRAAESVSSFANPHFYTDYTLSLLVPFLKSTPSPIMFTTITSICKYDPEGSIPYLEPIMNAFYTSLNTETDISIIFQKMEVIAYSIGFPVSKHIDQFYSIFKKHVLSIDCLNLCITLSFQLRSGFSDLATKLYPIILSNFANPDLRTTKSLLKLAAYMVLFQLQSLSELLNSISQVFFSKRNPAAETRVNEALKILTIITQQRPIDLYSVRIAQLCFRQLKFKQSKHVYELLTNLCLFGGLDIDYAEQESRFAGKEMPHLADIRNHLIHGRPIIEQVLFIPNLAPHLDKERIDGCIKVCPEPCGDVLHPGTLPLHNGLEDWLNEISEVSVSQSPETSIRLCLDIVFQYPQIRRDLFPIAFLSIWRNAREKEKISFSKIIETTILNSDFNQIGSTISYIANILDRAGCPLLIPDNILAGATGISALSLYQLERGIRLNPNSPTMIERLLRQNTKMGRFESAKGLLVNAGGEIARSELYRWLEQLGEWEKALDILQTKKHPKISNYVRCYANLQQWGNVRDLSLEFDMLTRDEQKSSALWFANAFFHSKDLLKTKKFIEYLDSDDPQSVISSVLYYIESGDYYTALETIKKGFSLLIKDRSIFSGTDVNAASRCLVAAQHFIELEEAISFKKGQNNKIFEVWENRIRNFNEDTDAWMKLIDIRLLVMKPEEHVNSCMKMISVLRKERKWRIIESYLSRLDQVSHFPNAVIGRLKIIWARDQKIDAIRLISNFTKVLLIKDNEEFQRIINDPEYKTRDNGIGFLEKFLETTHSNDKNAFAKFLKYEKDYGVNNKFIARVVRINASWQYNLYKANSTEVSSLPEIIKLFNISLELNNNDYRAWSGLAYACSRMLSHCESDVQTYAAIAIKGFLSATKLAPGTSLRHLCQMFSILFRYGENLELSIDIRRQISHLPPSVIHQTIPQVIVHITHQSRNVREIVDDVITRFSDEHFEAVVYPLSVLSLIPNTEKSDCAIEMMRRLSARHSSVYKDLALFIDGMHKAAVSWGERWIASIGPALRYIRDGDRQGFIRVLKPLFDDITPKCDFDESFYRVVKKVIDHSLVLFRQYANNDETVTKQLWDNLSNTHKELTAYLRSVDSIQLAKISAELAEKVNFSIVVPGYYDVEKSAPKLHRIEPRLEVLNTSAKPRILYVWDDSGKRLKFLLKGNEDLRLDQRIMQLFSLVNSLMNTNRNTRGFSVSIAIYPIVPFAPNAGLISWVVGADTMQQLVQGFRLERGRKENGDKELVKDYVAEKMNINSLNAPQRLELHEYICNNMPADELRESIWMNSPAPALWVERVRNFTVSTAIMSIVGYAIGLGDRHPSNIMIQRHTGAIVHIDFGESFESTAKRLQYPERVPFRLTRMLINALEGGSVEGTFRKICEDVTYVLRENISPIIAQLEIFLHEPIFPTRPINEKGRPKNEILRRVSEKLSGDDTMFDTECEHHMSVPKQVDMLISIASDKNRYCRHYVGWCPTW